MSGVIVFKSPYNLKKTEQIVANVIRIRKGTYKGNVGKWKAHDYWTFFNKKARFYYRELKDGTAVRAVFKGDTWVKAWSSFIFARNGTYGNVFGLNPNSNILNRKPVAVLSIQNEIKQYYEERIIESPSLSEAILGGLAFGPIGAIVGGTSGNQRTIGRTVTHDTGFIDVEILWDSGHITKERTKRGSDLYKEIVNMKPMNSAKLNELVNW